MRSLRNNRKIYGNDAIGVDSNNHILEHKPIIAVDFDGTLVRNKYPFIENPNVELLDWVRSNRDKYVFILWTCRHGEQLAYAVSWLRDEQNIVFDYINENVPWKIEQYGDTRKVFADYYIDDRNVSMNELFRDDNADFDDED